MTCQVKWLSTQAVVERSMRLSRQLCVVFAWMAAMSLAGNVDASTPTKELARGLVLERVGHPSALASAGLRAGDRILGFKTKDGAGQETEAAEPIETVFDWELLVVEEAPRSPTTLVGSRDGQRIEWLVAPGDWAARVRLESPALAAITQAMKARVTQAPSTAPQILGDLASSGELGRSSRAVEVAFLVGLSLEEEFQWEAATALLASAIQQSSTAETTAHLSHALGRVLLRTSQFSAAKEALETAMEMAKDRSGRLGWRLEVARCDQALGEIAWQFGDLELAERHLQRALDIRQRAAPEGLGFAESLTWLGWIDIDRSEFEQAESRFTRAHSIHKRLAPNSLVLAESLHALGVLAMREGRRDEASDRLHRSLQLRSELAPGGLEVAASRNEIGILYRRQGKLEDAEEAYRQALDLRERLVPESLDVANSLNNLGVLARSRGELVVAERYHRRALAIRENLAPGGFDVAESLNNLAVVALNRGDLALAEQALRKTLRIRKQLLPESLDVANSLNNLGGVASSQGEFELARTYHLQALELRRRLAPESASTATSLSNLGSVARRQGDVETALPYLRQALELRRKVAPGGLDVARSLHSIARLLLETDPVKAMAALSEASEIVKDRAPGSLLESEIELSLGDISLHREQFDSAHRHYTASLQLRQRWAPGSEQEAEAHHLLARLKRKEAKPLEALAHLEQALQGLENQVSRLSRSSDVRSGFRARFGPLYRDAIELYLQLDRIEESFLTLERYRAREFLTLLAERDLLFAADVPEALAIRRQALASQISQAQRSLSRLSDNADPARIEESQERLRLLLKEREVLAGEVRQVSPSLANLQAPEPLGAEAVRKQLEKDTAVLSFSVGDSSSLLFVLTAERLEVFPIPAGVKDLHKRVTSFRQLIRDFRPGDPLRAIHGPSLDRMGRELFELLIAPASELLAGKTRLLLLPDGPLHLLPFSALRRQRADAHEEYLVEWRSLSRAPSATLYSWTKQSPAATGFQRSTTHCSTQLMGFADPAPNEAARAAELVELRFARREVEAARSFFDQGSTRLFVGSDATESRVKQEAGEACILHFATHTAIDPKLPLNSSLVLSASNSVEQDEDGRLHVWEIFDEVRVDADLVVLSACSSALGKTVGGEGLLGVARAFLYAGARAVAATLWSVADEETATLITEFYRQLAKGLSPEQALRQAQVAMIDWSRAEPAASVLGAPYYWAAFELFGISTGSQ